MSLTKDDWISQVYSDKIDESATEVAQEAFKLRKAQMGSGEIERDTPEFERLSQRVWRGQEVIAFLREGIMRRALMMPSTLLVTYGLPLYGTVVDEDQA